MPIFLLFCGHFFSRLGIIHQTMMLTSTLLNYTSTPNFLVPFLVALSVAAQVPQHSPFLGGSSGIPGGQTMRQPSLTNRQAVPSQKVLPQAFFADMRRQASELLASLLVKVELNTEEEAFKTMGLLNTGLPLRLMVEFTNEVVKFQRLNPPLLLLLLLKVELLGIVPLNFLGVQAPQQELLAGRDQSCVARLQGVHSTVIKWHPLVLSSHSYRRQTLCFRCKQSKRSLVEFHPPPMVVPLLLPALVEVAFLAWQRGQHCPFS